MIRMYLRERRDLLRVLVHHGSETEPRVTMTSRFFPAVAKLSQGLHSAYAPDPNIIFIIYIYIVDTVV